MTAKTPAEGKSLPPVTVGKLADASRLIERLITENTSIFSDRIREYREVRATGSERSLTAEEAAQIASGLAGAAGDQASDIASFTAKIQQSDLKAVDQVPQEEMLLVAGLGTAPAALEAVQQMIALIEMPTADYRSAKESDTLDDEIRKSARSLDDLSLEEGRARASAALTHFQEAAGAQAGEVIGLIRDMMGQAIAQAASSDLSNLSPFSSLTGSLPPTDGTEE